MSYIEQFYKLKEEVSSSVKIVAVSKTKPASVIEELNKVTGHNIFGENKAQELEAKQEILPNDIEWHFIGHLQTNKIKYIAHYISLIQSVDSFKLLSEINKEAVKYNRIIPCLLQFHIAREEAKYGFTIEETYKMLEDKNFQELSNISVRGVMGMASFTDDKQEIRKEFKQLFQYYTTLKSRYFTYNLDFSEVSMGMSHDYSIAIEEGSTIIRIGTGIFGGR